MSASPDSDWRLAVQPQTRSLSSLIVAEDARLRTRLGRYIKYRYPAAQLHERRNLNDNQTVWDIRAGNYHLLMINYEKDDLDELEFLANLNTAGIAHTAILLLTQKQHLKDIRAIGTDMLGYLTHDNLEPNYFYAQIDEALSHAKRQPRPADDVLQNFPVDLTRSGYNPLRLLSSSLEGCVLLTKYEGKEYRVVKLQRKITGNERLIKRFLQESRVASQLNHEHVVKVYERGLANDTTYYIMEYLRLGTLSRLLQSGPVPPVDALRIVHGICAGLTEMHRQEIAHLDIKSSNVLFRDSTTPVVIDFGASQHQLLHNSYTLKHHALGTPSYMSPEQATGQPADGRSDLYSLGVMFFEMLTGRCPYRGDTVSDVLRQHLLAPIPMLPQELQKYQWVVDKLLAKPVEQRYQTTADLLTDIDALKI